MKTKKSRKIYGGEPYRKGIFQLQCMDLIGFSDSNKEIVSQKCVSHLKKFNHQLEI